MISESITSLDMTKIKTINRTTHFNSIVLSTDLPI